LDHAWLYDRGREHGARVAVSIAACVFAELMGTYQKDDP
jgi:hypothetical protein